MQGSLIDGEVATYINIEELHILITIDEVIRAVQRDRTRDLRQSCGQGDVCAQRDGICRGAGAFVGIRQGDAVG
ncbi:MAG: hypothetical protein M9918_15525 [Anaerolineae bacterium]|nr:hypothetical protein [Anaerolineae bacterium]